jgi:small subunit ribosomal protein S8
MMIDPISDMLTRIRNAQMKNITKIEMPYSSVKKAIADVLKEKKYINNVNVFKSEDGKKGLGLELKDTDFENGIVSIDRVSKSSRREYIKAKDIKSMRTMIISTSRGVMSSQEAKKNKLGGEVICVVA